MRSLRRFCCDVDKDFASRTPPHGYFRRKRLKDSGVHGRMARISGAEAFGERQRQILVVLLGEFGR